VDVEVAVGIAEPIYCLLHHECKNLFLVKLGCSSRRSTPIFGCCDRVVLAAVQEQIALAGMAVNVYKEVDLSALESLTDHLLHGVDLSAQFGVRILPLPIQVEPC